jgi:hypothetical protein
MKNRSKAKGKMRRWVFHVPVEVEIEVIVRAAAKRKAVAAAIDRARGLAQQWKSVHSVGDIGDPVDDPIRDWLR